MRPLLAAVIADLRLTIDSAVAERFPELHVIVSLMSGLRVESENVELERFKKEAVQEVRRHYDLESVRQAPVFRAYRDFFWRVGIDPTKSRPASEALIRRILAGNPLPKINTLVDAYNVASIRSEIALAAFDRDKLRGTLTMRFAQPSEKFLGIGMDRLMELNGGEIVIADERELVAIYPHRDAAYSKVTTDTHNILLLVCGVPGIPQNTLTHAAELAADYVAMFCGGNTRDGSSFL